MAAGAEGKARVGGQAGEAAALLAWAGAESIISGGEWHCLLLGQLHSPVALSGVLAGEGSKRPQGKEGG